MTDLRRPLDDEEWAALGELFDRPGGPNRDTIFGLLHAVATAPRMVPPSVWLPVALGDRDFGGDPTPIMLMRHYNTVIDALAAGRPLVPAPSEEQAIRDWCTGYMLGVRMDQAWANDDDSTETLLPIAVLAGDTPLNGPGEEHVIEDEEDWLREARSNLDGVVLDTYQVVAPTRRALAASMPVQQPIRRGPKVGRNDPCPCGSGKKYKKCCLGAR